MSSVKIFSGNASKYLANSIAEHYGRTLGDLSSNQFSDGEIAVEYKESVKFYSFCCPVCLSNRQSNGTFNGNRRSQTC